MISIVIPTITGREHLLEKTIEAIRENTDSDCEVIEAKDRPTCGQGWNAGIEMAEGEFVCLLADDLLPFPGWDEAAIQAVEDGVWPSPWIQRPDGSTEARGSMGAGQLLGESTPDETVCNSSPIPFFRRADWEKIGPCLPIHYYGDDFLAWRARSAGLQIELRGSYRFTHLEGTLGRGEVQQRAMADRLIYLKTISGEET